LNLLSQRNRGAYTFVLISTVVAVLHVGILLLDYLFTVGVRRASATEEAATGIVELELRMGAP